MDRIRSRFARKTLFALVVSVVAAGGAIFAAAPGGAVDEGEVLASDVTSGNQSQPVVARSANGAYVVAWYGNGTGDTDGIFLQRYDANGNPDGDVELVNTVTAGDQKNPAVAMDPDGDVVVAWESFGQDTVGADTYGIYARTLSAAGSFGTVFQVNSHTPNSQTQPSVAMAADGTFVIAWQSIGQDGSGQGVYAQRFDAAGAPQDSEFQVNTYTTLSQQDPSVAMAADGEFVITWTSNLQEGSSLSSGIYGQRYAADGTTIGATEFHINTTTAGAQSASSVAMDADGDFVVAWQSPDVSSTTGIWLQRFDGAGVAQGGETAVNSTTAGTQAAPAVTMDARGNFVVTWSGAGAGDSEGIWFQRYNASGVAQGGETAANSTTTDTQQRPAVAADADGDYVVAWESNLQDLSGTGAYSRRFAGPDSVDLSVTMADTTDPVAINGAIQYTLTVRNNNTAATPTGIAAIDAQVGNATGIVVTDTMPTTVSGISASGTNWDCTTVTNTVTCASGAALLPATTAPVITISASAPGTPGTITNNADIAADQDDTITGNNSASETTGVCLSANGGTLAFSSTPYSGNENNGANDGSVTISVTRSGALCGLASVRYATSDGTALAGLDYVAATNTLTWGEGENATKTFVVTLENDTIDENNETFNVTLSNAEGATLNSTSPQPVTITDTDTTPTVSFTPNSATVSTEGSSGSTAVTVTAALSAGCR